MAKFKCFPVSQEQRGLDDDKDQTDHKVFVLRPEFASVERSMFVLLVFVRLFIFQSFQGTIFSLFLLKKN